MFPERKWHWCNAPVVAARSYEAARPSLVLKAECGRWVQSVRVLRSNFGGRPPQSRCKDCHGLYVDFKVATIS